MMTSQGLGGAHPKLATVERDGCGSLWNFFCTATSVSPILIQARISPTPVDLCSLLSSLAVPHPGQRPAVQLYNTETPKQTTTPRG